jgi:polysaccharide biosynthesis protein PslH
MALFGAWTHQPNRIAADWLAAEVWPAVRAAVPEARLLLMGPGRPPAALLDQDGVDALGRVGSLAEMLGAVRIAVVPIRQGMGSRVKFIESLASGAAVVSTSEGAEGFYAEGAFVLADDAKSFVDACVELLRDEARAAALGRRGRELALARYSWDRVSMALTGFAQSDD